MAGEHYKSGSTFFLVVNQEIDVNMIDEIIFTIKGAQTLTMRYPEDVTYADGRFFIPLTQERTAELAGSNGSLIQIEGQVNYKDKSVWKTSKDSVFFESTLATEFVEGNTPSAYPMKEVNLKIEGGIIIAEVSLKEIELAKEEIEAAAVAAVEKAKEELDDKYAADLGGCQFGTDEGGIYVKVEVQ